jgi:hypothetical protein
MEEWILEISNAIPLTLQLCKEAKLMDKLNNLKLGNSAYFCIRNPL